MASGYDETSRFIPYGTIPNKPITLEKELGNLSFSGLASLADQVLQGSIGYRRDNGNSLNVSADLGGVNNINYTGDNFQVGKDKQGYYGSYTGNNTNIEARPDYLSGSYKDGNLTADGMVDKYGYSAGLNLNLPMVDPSMSSSAGIDYNSYDKQPSAHARVQKMLEEGGFVEATGQLTPKGYELMLSGGIKF